MRAEADRGCAPRLELRGMTSPGGRSNTDLSLANGAGAVMPSDPVHESFPAELAKLEPGDEIYLRPLGLLDGRSAASMCARGEALPLAGGRIAFTACELLIRRQGQISRHLTGLAGLKAWCAGHEALPAAARLRDLLERITAPRFARADDRPRLMGIVNVTPDSFSDGGEHLDPAAALAHCRALAEAGADILDIGGESTRPGATAVPPDEELARVVPVLEGLAELRRAFPHLLVSIDTRHAEVMEGAIARGVDIINDVTALTGDPRSLGIAAASAARVVLMHMQGTPETMNEAPVYEDVAADVMSFLEARIRACEAAGIPRDRLIVDPGIGFGKRGRENQEILRNLTLFHGLGCPILLGLSRKGLGVAKGASPREREPVSLAAAILALSQGVQMLRVHDVAATRRAVELWDRLSAT